MNEKELEIIDETIKWMPHTKVWDIATIIRKNIDVLENGGRIKLDKKEVGSMLGGKAKLKDFISILEREKVFGNYKFHVGYDGDRIIYIELMIK